MSCEHLVCARCAGPVADGRCPSCRGARAELHRHGFVLTPQLALLLVAIVAVLALVAAHLGG